MPPKKQLVVGILLLLASCFLLNRETAAGDYEVAYAIDAYEQICRLVFMRSTISISLGLISNSRNRVFDVFVDDRVKECCLFSDGTNRTMIDTEQRFHRLSIFEGKQRRGNEFVQNNKIGEIFLGFSNFR
jgi:hypothetical protein